jgi:hypothetical protein
MHVFSVFELEDNDRGVILPYFASRRNACDAAKISRFFTRRATLRRRLEHRIRRVDHHAQTPRESYVSNTHGTLRAVADAIEGKVSNFMIGVTATASTGAYFIRGAIVPDNTYAFISNDFTHLFGRPA